MTSTPYGPHWGDLHALGATTVETNDLQRVRVRVDESIRRRTILVVTGRWGYGKSYSLARAVEQRAPVHNVDVVWLEMQAAMSPREQWHELFFQVAGTRPQRSASAGDVVRMLHDALSENPRVIVVDEAQEVKPTLFKQLRWLHEHANADFGLIFSGTPVLWKNLLPGEVKSRTDHHVEVRGLSNDEAAELLPKLHPIFAAADPEDLRRWNRSSAHGSLRWWARLLSNAAHLLPHLGGVLDTAAMTQICDDMPGAHP